MEQTMEKNRKQIQIEALMAFSKELMSNGFTVIVSARHPFEWLNFSKDGHIGYVQPDYFFDFSFSTVHKPSREHGTGINVGEHLDLTIENANKALANVPGWYSRKSKGIEKYKGLDEFIAVKNNSWSPDYVICHNPKFLPEWNSAQFDAMDKAIERHFKGKTLNTHKGEIANTSVLDNTFSHLETVLGLAYTSSSSYAGYWICNVTLYLDADKRWQYSAFAIGTDGKFYATIQDKYENEFIIEL